MAVSSAEKTLRQLEESSDQLVLLALCGIAAVAFYFSAQLPAVVSVAVVASFDLSVYFLWAVFACGVLGAVLCLLLALISIVPSQFLPDSLSTTSKKSQKIRIVLTAGVLAVLVWTWQTSPGTPSREDAPRWTVTGVIGVVLQFVLFLALAWAGIKIRAWIRNMVITKMVLPAVSITNDEHVISHGRRVPVRTALMTLRAQLLRTSSAGDASGLSTRLSQLHRQLHHHHHQGGSDGLAEPRWVNASILGADDTRVDAAYYEYPDGDMDQPSEKRWVLFLLGNGQLYEFSLQELEQFSLNCGLSVFVLNYRSVGLSQGTITHAGDLVVDAIHGLQYMEDRLGADPNNILVFGHSIGGSIGALARACHSPTGPILCDRSFSSLGAAGAGVLSMVFGTLIGKEAALPTWLVSGLLASVLKGRLNTVQAMKMITGKRVILYHEDDKIIPYKISSLHKGIVDASLRSGIESIRLGDVAVADTHNCPLDRFPEYHQILRLCRTALGLPDTLPQLSKRSRPHFASSPSTSPASTLSPQAATAAKAATVVSSSSAVSTNSTNNSTNHSNHSGSG